MTEKQEKMDKLLTQHNWKFLGEVGSERGYGYPEREYTLSVRPSGAWVCYEPTVYVEHMVDEGTTLVSLKAFITRVENREI